MENENQQYNRTNTDRRNRGFSAPQSNGLVGKLPPQARDLEEAI